MLKRATIAEIKKRIISKENGFLVVTMRMYPRFLSKALIDDYRQSLAPQSELFEKYRKFKKKLGDQNESFELANYQQEFQLSDSGLRDLAELVDISRQRDVFMICQCEKNERCHVDLMLLMAESEFGAKIEQLPFSYSNFRSRLSKLEKK